VNKKEEEEEEEEENDNVVMGMIFRILGIGSILRILLLLQCTLCLPAAQILRSRRSCPTLSGT
jgi:hypothetical protein